MGVERLRFSHRSDLVGQNNSMAFATKRSRASCWKEEMGGEKWPRTPSSDSGRMWR